MTLAGFVFLLMMVMQFLAVVAVHRARLKDDHLR